MEGAIELVDRLIALHFIRLRRRNELVLASGADTLISGLVAIRRNDDDVLWVDTAGAKRRDLIVRRVVGNRSYIERRSVFLDPGGDQSRLTLRDFGDRRRIEFEHLAARAFLDPCLG